MESVQEFTVLKCKSQLEELEVQYKKCFYNLTDILLTQKMSIKKSFKLKSPLIEDYIPQKQRKIS